MTDYHNLVKTWLSSHDLSLQVTNQCYLNVVGKKKIIHKYGKSKRIRIQRGRREHPKIWKSTTV